MPSEDAIGLEDVRRYLAAHPDLPPGAAGVPFLAHGEYSLNFRVRRDEGDLVARLVTGTPMGLPLGAQAPYEHRAHLNTHNFVVEGDTARLLDWEKARVAPRMQDLAHFLLPTTTLWRDDTAALLTAEQERSFVEAYLERSPVEDGERFETQLEAMKTIVSLRAVSWCAWALQESARGARDITNEETLEKSRRHLAPGFLRDLFAA